MAGGVQAEQKSVIDQLVAYAREIERYHAGGIAVEIRLSTLRGKVTRGNILFAVNMFRTLVDQHQGRLFILDNSDLFFVYRGLRVQEVKSAAEKLRLLYSEHLLSIDEPKMGGGFIIWYNLSAEPDRFRQAMERLGETAAPAVLAAPLRPPAPGGPAAPEAGGTALARLMRAADALERVRVSTLLRRQKVFRVAPGATPVAQFEELYLSIPDVEQAVCPGGRLTEDRWLFQYFTQLLDRRMLLYLRDSDGPDLAGGFSLNLNLSSVLSPEFRPFADVLGQAARSTIVIEFQKTDVFSDLGSYFYVRDMMRERGFQVCLDGVTELSLPLVDARRLGLDYLKLRWNPDLDEDRLGRWHAELSRAGFHESCRVILCRVDSQKAVAFGQSAGIDLFQGRHFEARAI